MIILLFKGWLQMKKWWMWAVSFILIGTVIFFTIKVSSSFDEVHSGDLLNFYGSVLSFIGTLILGLIASHQSWKANRLSERLLKLEEEQFMPIVDIQEIMEYPNHTIENLYNNSIHLSLNDTYFSFSENNEVSFSNDYIFVFSLKNICSSHIISVDIGNIEQKIKYDNQKEFVFSFNRFSINSGIRVLSNGESQLLMISGIQLKSPLSLTPEEMLSQGYINRLTELTIHFELTNIKGQKFNEIIRFSFLAMPSEDDLYFPCITDKEIVSISPIK